MPNDGNTNPFNRIKINKYLKKVDGWSVKKNNNKNYYLEKEIKFKTFTESHQFTNTISKIAELEGHHPDISFGWGYVRIKIHTHAIKGLAENDFILAAKINQV